MPITTVTATRRAFSLQEFCIAYNTKKDAAYDAIRRGDLIARKMGKRTIVLADDAERYIASLPRLELPPTANKHAPDTF